MMGMLDDKGDLIVNPCIFKRQCKECTIANMDDRPSMCAAIRCEHFTPCKDCKDNKTLDANGLCNACAKNRNKKPVIARMASGDLAEVPVAYAVALQSGAAIPDTVPDDFPVRQLSVTIPGTPPGECSEPEKEYYLSQWDQYVTFYRDPTAKAVVHNIIILEIELNWLVNYITIKRGAAPNKEYENQRSRIIHNLTELHGMLPKKEATDESDDERFFSMVYQRYCEERKLRSIGKVSRLISPEALALAPQLYFPVDPQRILTNLGYKTVDAIAACDHIVLDDLPDDPKQMLEWMGFFLNEQYAMPLNREPDIAVDAVEPQLVEDEVDLEQLAEESQ